MPDKNQKKSGSNAKDNKKGTKSDEE